MPTSEHILRRLRIFDTWKRSLHPEDRKDFETDIVATCNAFYVEGINKGRQDVVEEIEKIEKSKTLPLEDPTRGAGRKIPQTKL